MAGHQRQTWKHHHEVKHGGGSIMLVDNVSPAMNQSKLTARP